MALTDHSDVFGPAFDDGRHDSAALGTLGAVVHPVDGAARLIGSVHRGTRQIGEFEVLTDAASERGQVDVDLARIGWHAVPFRLRPDGYVVLHVSSGASGYYVVLAEPGENPSANVFDSRKLGDGDLFALTLVRPGRYAVQAGKGTAVGEIRVAYPTPSGKPYRPDEPVLISYADGELTPREVDVDPAQGLVFAIQDRGSAIAVELTEPDDSPRGKGDRDDDRSGRRAVDHNRRGRR